MKQEIEPLRTLESVLSWRPTQEDELACGKVKLAKINRRVPNARKTLLCHDMQGGYVQDRFVEGCSDIGYRFYHWQYLDEFIYFSHHFITIPPPMWTNTAHRHGVKMLGTLITEWDDGKAICSDFLKSSRAFRSLANKMVEIMKFYGFDGWLVNIENVIQKDQVGNLRDFVAYLTERCHTEVTGSKVIWYDSVTRNGELSWQNQLNEENRMFFEACDAIFLNYTWDEDKLSDSHTLAGSMNRVTDVYVGVDVFGRGCPGGGGYNTHEAMSMIQDAKLSAAIFAPGWVFETQDIEHFTANQYKFWGLLHDYCSPSVFTTLDISTSFCHGYGLKYFSKGENVKNASWYNLSLQQIQPNVDLTGQRSELKVEYIESDAYVGGGCLLLQRKIGPANTATVPFNLFQFDAMVESSSLYVSYTYKDPESAGVDPVISLTLTNSGQSLLMHLGQQGKAVEGRSKTDQEEMWISPLVNESDLRTRENSNGWVTRCYKVSQSLLSDSSLQTVSESLLSDWSLQTVSVSLSGDESSEKPLTCLLGQIQIHQEDGKEENDVRSITFQSLPTTEDNTQQEQTRSAPVDLTTRKDNSAKTHIINWEDSNADDDVHYYNVYQKSSPTDLKLVGQSVTTKCTVSVDKLDGDWYIQRVSNKGCVPVLPKAADVSLSVGHV